MLLFITKLSCKISIKNRKCNKDDDKLTIKNNNKCNVMIAAQVILIN